MNQLEINLYKEYSYFIYINARNYKLCENIE